MSKIDIFLLATLFGKNRLSLSTIVQRIQFMKITQPPSRITIYQRLHTLKGNELVNISWEEGKKLYEISPQGMLVITEFKEQLSGLKLV
ncbi:MAG TPA: hypothetical protein DCS19_12160 [Flavobacterium sp.]|jgi:Transcriptional regulator PadR-like family.|nr:hypothetical protein [Flavobacterium sp.]